MNLGRGLIFIILIAFTLGFIYMFSLGAFEEIDFNEQYYEEVSFISANYSNGYVSDPNVYEMQVYLSENDVKGYSYILGDDYSGIVLDEVMLDKFEILDYPVMRFGGSDYVLSEFPYKNRYSFYIGDMRDKYNIEQYEKMMNVSFDNRTVVYDSISEKIIYLHY